MSSADSVYIAAFIVGVVSSGHCLGMCGGISAALGIRTTHQCSNAYVVAYNVGRLCTYAALGLLVGIVGQHALAFFPSLALPLRLLAGFFLIAMGLYLSGWWMGLTVLERAGTVVWRRVQPLTRRLLPVTSLPRAMAAGVLWGLLPCGLVYSSLGLAAAQASPGSSAVVMASFALGTMPSMLLAGVLGERILRYLRRQRVRSALAVLVMGMGLLTWWMPITHSLAPAAHHHHSAVTASEYNKYWATN